MRKLNYVLLGVSVAIMLLACSPAEETPAVESPPRSVRITPVVSRDLPVVVNAVGRLTPNREVVVSAEVSGIVAHYDADVGSSVTRGALLAKIDSADYTLALQEAKANLLAARSNLPVAKRSFERAQRLLPEKVITPEHYDQADAAYKSAQAQVVQLETIVAQARRRLEKTAIIAPFSGHVTRRLVETGQYIGFGDPVMQLADMGTMRVRIHVNELDYVHVDPQDPVTVTVEAFPGGTITGRVDKIGVQADSRTNTFEVEILVGNPDFLLKAGLTARVVIQTDSIADAIMIPQETVLFRENRKEVFILDADDRAVARTVTLGRMVGSAVRVLDGLTSGQRLVVAGAQYLKPGDRVVVAP
jgi:RND family efflux transporter MFP subunit